MYLALLLYNLSSAVCVLWCSSNNKAFGVKGGQTDKGRLFAWADIVKKVADCRGASLQTSAALTSFLSEEEKVCGG